jgi:acyl-coenzyme A synthetase/AMP-(fatty) acid ligase
MSIAGPRGIAPPTNGSVALPETIDFHRENNPDVPIYVYDDIHNVSAPLTKITFLEFGRACDRVAHCLRPERAGRDREVVAIIAHSSSLLYQTVVLGIMRAGLIVSFHILEIYVVMLTLYSHIQSRLVIRLRPLSSY